MSLSPKSIQPYQRSGSTASSYNNLSVKFELCNPRKKNESMSKERAKRGTLPPAQEVSRLKLLQSGNPQIASFSVSISM
ncbi:hypothetical protein RchiOBHm_Chr2g0149411 [Rosa chinensis]|uniref:Uncharacterized protein n=1 Tax=Rosa chinensis TaxID=74649 RepID=A0A2P6RZM5_ROSCH|nr:hypothetical protein RchiOBHm_Chr2g0149411 [Rosa chinensis]